MPISEAAVHLLFFGSIVLVLHSYIFYPLILAMLDRGVAHTADDIPESQLPAVSILVAAHNEAEVIGERVSNALASDYPADRLEVLIASDGSSDATEAIVAGFADSRVRLLAHHPNRGKSYTLNRAIPEARGKVIVMSDANTHFESNAVRCLVNRLMTEDQPLAVCGKLVLTDPESGNNLDSLYWRYESWMKHREGALQAALGANGGIYAIWRARYCRIPDNTILDDMSIPLLMKLRQGGSVVFESQAVATEEAPAQIADEFGRRVRIGVGAFQSLTFLWPLLNPKHGLTAFGFFSHKLLRWVTPQLLIVAMGAALVGIQYPFYQAVWIAAVGAGLLAVWGRQVTGRGLVARFLKLLSLFVAMNAALLVGFIRWLYTPQSGTWKRTARDSGSNQ